MKNDQKKSQPRPPAAAVRKLTAPAPLETLPPQSATAKFSAPAPAAATTDSDTASAQPPAFQPRVYAPGDIACCHQNDDLTNCGAEANEPCKWQQPGMEGAYHAERIAAAAAASQREGIKPTKEQFDEAAWDSGLF